MKIRSVRLCALYLVGAALSGCGGGGGGSSPALSSSVSPDKTKEAYIQPSNGRETLFVRNRDGSGARAVSEGFFEIQSVVWADDSGHLAYIAYSGGRATDGAALEVSDLSGSRPIATAPNARLERIETILSYTSQPNAHPSGGVILFRGILPDAPPGEPHTLFRVNQDGSDLSRLGPAPP